MSISDRYSESTFSVTQPSRPCLLLRTIGARIPDAGGSLAAVSVTSEPRSPSRAVSPDVTAQVEYRIIRNGVVREVDRGKLLKTDVCDAHPELLRAARNVGRATKEVCPICDDGRLVTVTFVFGAKLPPGGRCPGTAAELKALTRREEPVLCYEVEVCPSCAWHHLMRKYPAGGRTPRQKKAAPSP
jgi:hypothetical protein